jgi:hypothetical protein
MSQSRIALAAFAIALVVEGATQAGFVKSGPQVGEKVPGPFYPLNLTGPDAGKKSCQYCKNGARPVVAIFARQLTPAVAQLVKKIDAATSAGKEQDLRSYVVFCSDQPGLEQQLKDAVQKMHLHDTVVTLYKSGGPERYGLAPEADVTVLIYRRFTVKANHAFKADELNDTAMNTLFADLARMLSEN